MPLNKYYVRNHRASSPEQILCPSELSNASSSHINYFQEPKTDGSNFNELLDSWYLKKCDITTSIVQPQKLKTCTLMNALLTCELGDSKTEKCGPYPPAAQLQNDVHIIWILKIAVEGDQVLVLEATMDAYLLGHLLLLVGLLKETFGHNLPSKYLLGFQVCQFVASCKSSLEWMLSLLSNFNCLV